MNTAALSPFDPASVRSAVAAALAHADIPAGHTSALTVVATSTGSVAGALAWKVNETWHVDAVFTAQDQQIEGAVAVTASW